MIFFPYRVDLGLKDLPILTILVAILCLVIYYQQSTNEQAVVQGTREFCAERRSVLERMTLKDVAGHDDQATCMRLMLKLRLAKDRQAQIDELAGKGRFVSSLTAEQSQELMGDKIRGLYTRYAAQVPDYLTEELWYRPGSWNPWKMITAAFAHASWSHVIGNLFFFFAFAATVEVILGAWRYVAMLLSLALGTHVAYSLSVLGMDSPLPTVGLSGVVMGMMGLFAFFLPEVRIRCLLWVVILIRTLAVPAWLLAAWYFGWDLYSLFSGDDKTGINVVAHVSGALLGYGLGVILFRARRVEVRDMLGL